MPNEVRTLRDGVALVSRLRAMAEALVRDGLGSIALPDADARPGCFDDGVLLSSPTANGLEADQGRDAGLELSLVQHDVELCDVEEDEEPPAGSDPGLFPAVREAAL